MQTNRILIIGFLIPMLWTCGGTPCPDGKTCIRKPQQYMDYLNKDVNSMMHVLNEFSQSTRDNRTDDAREWLDSLTVLARTGSEHLEKLQPMEGDTNLYPMYGKLYRLFADACAEGFPGMLKLQTRDSAASLIDIAGSELFVETFDRRFDEITDSLFTAQKEFAEKHKLEVISGD